MPITVRIISNLSGYQPFQLWREADAALHTLFPDKNHDQQQTCSAPPVTIKLLRFNTVHVITLTFYKSHITLQTHSLPTIKTKFLVYLNSHMLIKKLYIPTNCMPSLHIMLVTHQLSLTWAWHPFSDDFTTTLSLSEPAFIAEIFPEWKTSARNVNVYGWSLPGAT